MRDCMYVNRPEFRHSATFVWISALLLLSAALMLTGCNRTYDKGPVNDATLRTLARGGPVKDDLIARGLFIESSADSSGSPVPGQIKVGEIEKLVKAGVYSIDKEGYLTFGPANPTPKPTEAPTAQEAPDDIVPAPGLGPTYRANIHQQGVPDRWPPIQSKTINLANPYGPAQITYRDNIETEAGQTRNNIIGTYLPGVDTANTTLAPLEASFIPLDLPVGFSVVQTGLWHGADPARQSKVFLQIVIDQQVKPGDYRLNLRATINGNDYGTIPCVVSVVQTVPLLGLTQAERDKVVEIALKSPEASSWLQGRTDYKVGPIDWYAMVFKDGRVEAWSIVSPGSTNIGLPPPYLYQPISYYPGVTIAVGQGTIYQMQIAVDLNAGKAVMVDGPYPWRQLTSHPR